MVGGQLQYAVCEAEVLGHTSSETCQVFLGIPSVDRVLVLVVIACQRNGGRVNAVAILVEHGVAIATPTIELTVHVYRVRCIQRIFTHVDTECHIVNTASVIGRSSSIIVGCRVIITTRHVILADAGPARSPAHCIEDHGVRSCNIKVTVCKSSFFDHARANWIVKRSQVFFISPRIHLVLVAVILTWRQVNRCCPNAIHVVVAHLVAIRTECVPASSNVDESKRSSVVVHVHIEGHRQAVCRISTSTIVARAASIKAVDIEDKVSFTKCETTVAKFVRWIKVTCRSAYVLLIATPSVDHVLKLIVSRSEVDHASEDIVSITIGQDIVTRTAPIIKRTRYVDGLRSIQIRIGHVHLECYRVGCSRNVT